MSMTTIEQASYSHDDVEVENRESLYQGFTQLEKVTLKHRLFGQSHYTQPFQRELIRRKQAAGVLLYNHTQQKFALIEQFRVGALDDTQSPWQLEIIAGVLDGDEPPEECVRRESVEESGCQIDELTHLFSFYPSAGACSELFHLYAAQTDLPEHGGIFGLPEENENIQLHILDYSQIEMLLSSGLLRNAPVIMALQWLWQQIQLSTDLRDI